MRGEALLMREWREKHHAETEIAPFRFLGEKDDSPLRKHLNAVIPVSFAMVGGKIFVSCYPSLTEPIAEHFTRYEDPVSEEAPISLDRLLRPHLAKWGYRPSAFPTRYARSMLLPDDWKPHTEILQNTRRLTEEDRGKLINKASMNLADCIRRPAFAVVEEQTVFAVACVNSATDTALCSEIGVECAIGYRRRGYALSCVTALSSYLWERGESVLYQHYMTNVGSGKLAEAVGFLPVGTFFAYTAMQ